MEEFLQKVVYTLAAWEAVAEDNLTSKHFEEVSDTNRDIRGVGILLENMGYTLLRCRDCFGKVKMVAIMKDGEIICKAYPWKEN